MKSFIRHLLGITWVQFWTQDCGACRDEKTQLLFSENLQSCKIGVGLENWGTRGEELLLNAPAKEDAVTTAQAPFPYRAT